MNQIENHVLVFKDFAAQLSSQSPLRTPLRIRSMHAQLQGEPNSSYASIINYPDSTLSSIFLILSSFPGGPFGPLTRKLGLEFSLLSYTSHACPYFCGEGEPSSGKAEGGKKAMMVFPALSDPLQVRGPRQPSHPCCRRSPGLRSYGTTDGGKTDISSHTRSPN